MKLYSPTFAIMCVLWACRSVCVDEFERIARLSHNHGERVEEIHYERYKACLSKCDATNAKEIKRHENWYKDHGDE